MFAVVTLIMGATPPPQKALAYQVDPFIGTDWVGNTYPGANAPFGIQIMALEAGIELQVTSILIQPLQALAIHT